MAKRRKKGHARRRGHALRRRYGRSFGPGVTVMVHGQLTLDPLGGEVFEGGGGELPPAVVEQIAEEIAHEVVPEIAADLAQELAEAMPETMADAIVQEG